LVSSRYLQSLYMRIAKALLFSSAMLSVFTRSILYCFYKGCVEAAERRLAGRLGERACRRMSDERWF
jgi:hypothetical protein